LCKHLKSPSYFLLFMERSEAPFDLRHTYCVVSIASAVPAF